ncbi:MAG: ATP-binding protein [Nitrospiraceae bacterium]|nr:MAG: ATP-binding protein [Nitrospiraceae bacterium]
MKDSAVITIPADAKYLCVLRSVTSKMAELSGLGNGEIEEVVHAVDEACSNSIKYACRGDSSKEIAVTFHFNDASFNVTIEDTGIKADPDAIRGRDLDDVRPGGLGVHFIHKAFDVVSFDERKEEGNRLSLVRHRKEHR